MCRKRPVYNGFRNDEKDFNEGEVPKILIQKNLESLVFVGFQDLFPFFLLCIEYYRLSMCMEGNSVYTTVGKAIISQNTALNVLP